MRLTFRRMADRRAVESLVERDDGVVFSLRGAGGGAGLPHDLVHALVEADLGVRDGIWGCVADGAEVLPGERAASGLAAERLAAAAGALRAAGRRWAAMRPGEERVLDWPGRPGRRRGAGSAAR